MAQTVIGIFDSLTEAQDAAMQLTNSGFTRENIDIADQSATSGTGTSTDTYNEEDNDSISNFFSSLFGNDDDTSRYSNVARRSAIVTVHVQSPAEAERAADILDEYGAVDIDERASQYRSGTGTTATGVREEHAESTIPIIEEQLEVGKREVETGGIRLRSRIIERPVEEHLRLRQEHVWVERTPTNRPATEADFTKLKAGDINVTEHAEVPMVDKQARVVEEVSFGTEVEEHDENIKGTVRKTDVEIDDLDKDTDLNRPTGI
ncbi:YsnF/AvaK domain-containing protein [Pontibacter silvestris]|uniref:YsnF/AvaK domain-containing protein n=1 Tax=Pontibacter silvestris TaxID=2305183 RepID=A0ABW4X3I0_9BACT|nr:YsnF/AvaK domain-containing protein [Pontibacter silvestris]MCC9134838.1 YsnF/AvaK domain-containing protein [Pontibacter silvestris]